MESDFNRRTALCMLAGVGMAALPNSPLAQQATFAAEFDSNLRLLAPNVYVFEQLAGPGKTTLALSNCGLVVGPDSLLAIDATAAPLQAQRFAALAYRASHKRFKRVILTHEHDDHLRGLQFLQAAEIIAHEQCRQALLAADHTQQPAAWRQRTGWAAGTEVFDLKLPTTTYSDALTLYDYGDVEVRLFWPGRAHTLGDTIVHLPNQKIAFIGDLGFFQVTPMNGNGYVADWIKVCDRLLDMDVDTYVPGHGAAGGKTQLQEMRDYLVLIYAQAKRSFQAGLSAGRAAAEVELGKYRSWIDADRIVINVTRLYAEFAGTITPTFDRAAYVRANDEYQTIVKSR